MTADEPDLISALDELPLWSAPFGLKLLEVATLKKAIQVLDIGCGSGFPLIEIAQRLGRTSRIFGIDPEKPALERARYKIGVLNIEHVMPLCGTAEQLPFPDRTFDLILSNNGLNNVRDPRSALKECSRVCRPGAQVVISYNLKETMIGFYGLFHRILKAHGLDAETERLKSHILAKRMPLADFKRLLSDSGLTCAASHFNTFHLEFMDGTTMMRHGFISHWFLSNWRNILPEEHRSTVFGALIQALDEMAALKGSLLFKVPFATLNCYRTN
ncbi:class I SAM-dependent methyltransferase [bacterium]|nr:class I SAM-dependent methyltransferase [bacterium]